MSRCDERNVTCLGASWSTEECVLALGPYVKVADPDHMAFIRAAIPPAPYPALSTGSLPRPPISTGLSYLNMSRYDGSIFPQPALILTNPIAQPTITATDPPFPTPSSLDPYCSYVSGVAVACEGSAIPGTGYAPAPTPESNLTATHAPEDTSTPASASDFPTTARGGPFTNLPSGWLPYPDDPYCFYIVDGDSKNLVCTRHGSGDSPVDAPVTASDSEEDISTPTPAPSEGLPQPYGGFKGPWGGGSPPWAHEGGDYGVDEGSRHHKPQGSWWQGGRPQWSHWGWGGPGSRHGQKNRREK
jgi:hypothetical protein